MISKIKEFLIKHSEKIIFILFCLWVFSPFITLVLSRINFSLKSVVWYGFLSIIGIVLVITSFVKIIEEKDYKKFIPILLFLIWSAICTFKAHDLEFALYGHAYRKEGFNTYFLYSGYFIGAFYLTNKDYILKFMKVLSISAVLLCLFQHILGPIENNSIFQQFNHFGYYLMISIMVSIFNFIIEKKIYKKIIYFLFYGYLLYELVINDTFGCYLAIFITLILYFIYVILTKKKNRYILLTLIVFLGVSLSVKNVDGENLEKKNMTKFKNDVVTLFQNKDEIAVNNAGTHRGWLWRNGIELIKKEPIFGYGLDGVEDEYKELRVNNDRPHNIIIQMALFLGVPGMLMYVGFVLFLYIKNLIIVKRLDEISIAVCFISGCYFISSMFGNSMYYTSPYYLIFLGFVMRNVYLKKES